MTRPLKVFIAPSEPTKKRSSRKPRFNIVRIVKPDVRPYTGRARHDFASWTDHQPQFIEYVNLIINRTTEIDDTAKKYIIRRLLENHYVTMLDTFKSHNMKELYLHGKRYTTLTTYWKELIAQYKKHYKV